MTGGCDGLPFYSGVDTVDGLSGGRGAVASELVALSIDAHDPARLGDFWANLLGWTQAGNAVTPMPGDDTGFDLNFLASDEPKQGQNQAHFDLTSTSEDDQRVTVARALTLGAQTADVGQRRDESHVVLADPEGNEFCVIEAGNRFLADCGFVGALACSGSQAVGYFWSAALNWPLVWDEDQETAIRSAAGGPKITWGGEPAPAEHRPNRLRFDLAAAGESLGVEVDRLVALGARVRTVTTDRASMIDPDGNDFGVRATRH